MMHLFFFFFFFTELVEDEYLQNEYTCPDTKNVLLFEHHFSACLFVFKRLGHCHKFHFSTD